MRIILLFLLFPVLGLSASEPRAEKVTTPRPRTSTWYADNPVERLTPRVSVTSRGLFSFGVQSGTQRYSTRPVYQEQPRPHSPQRVLEQTTTKTIKETRVLGSDGVWRTIVTEEEVKTVVYQRD